MPTLAQASIYFRAYTNGALREVGLGDEYIAKLGPWRAMLADGLDNLGRMEWTRFAVRLPCLGREP